MNQLYWQRRPVYKKLIAAAEARRAAHAKKLAGKNADIAAAEADHSAALRAANEEIRSLFTDAGETATSATMHAVMETLQALPGDAPPGRLTTPLKPAGFEALAGLVSAKAHTLRGLTPEPTPARTRDKDTKDKDDDEDDEPDPRRAKRDADARRKEVASFEKALRVARADAKKAESALAAARKALAQEKAERDRLQDQLQFAMKKIDDASNEVREREGELARAAQEQSHLEAKLGTLRE